MVWFFNMLPFLSLFFRQLYRIHVNIIILLMEFFLSRNEAYAEAATDPE